MLVGTYSEQIRLLRGRTVERARSELPAEGGVRLRVRQRQTNMDPHREWEALKTRATSPPFSVSSSFHSLLSFPSYRPLSLAFLLPFSMSGPVRTPRATAGNPPRPPNAWILYRSDKQHQLPPVPPGQPRRPQSEVSKTISNMWKNESDSVKAEYENRAEQAKTEHARLYPNYRFCPMKKADKEKLKEEARIEKEKAKAEARKARLRGHHPYYATSLPVASTSTQYLDYVPLPQWGPRDARGIPGLSPPWSQASSPSPSTPSTDSPASDTVLVPRISAQPSPPQQTPDASLSAQTSVASSSPRPEPSSSCVPSISQEKVAPASRSLHVPQSRETSISHSPASGSPFPAQPWPPAPVASTSTQSAGNLGQVLASDWPCQADLQLYEQTYQQDAVSFRLPQVDVAAAQGYQSADFNQNEMQALLASTGDPSVYQVHGLDFTPPNNPPESVEFGLNEPMASPLADAFAQFLAQFPFEPLEGTFPTPSDILEAQQLDTGTGGHGQQGDSWFQQPAAEAHQQELFGGLPGESMFQYLDFGDLASGGGGVGSSTPAGPVPHLAGFGETQQPAASSSIPSYVQSVAVPAQAAARQPYVPPSGAANANTRRVGGSWKPPFQVRQSSGETSRTPSWDVPAS
ncbi:hypothetical protein EW146_g625 [Bondarzewia mesenterica]|uniref:HMG box domain-containing protein n=1 Tax=Bondarzewia mesenterica TaxID=1095465 RepID=A0A4V3XGB5_9AGAM|nr:hypothetical protein EW146_g625 [Bondarzewia mesenterica]